MNAGRFNHIGHPNVRLEGQTAWGVWLRVDHWRGAHSTRPRLRCGVLYHVANRELTFHGSAIDVTQLLLPIFEEWTYSTMNQMPSARPVSPPPFDDPRAPMSFDQTLLSGAPPRGTAPHQSQAAPVPGISQPPDPSWSRPQSSVNSVLATLVNVCQANQETMRMLVEEVRTLRREVVRQAWLDARHLRSATRLHHSRNTPWSQLGLFQWLTSPSAASRGHVRSHAVETSRAPGTTHQHQRPAAESAALSISWLHCTTAIGCRVRFCFRTSPRCSRSRGSVAPHPNNTEAPCRYVPAWFMQ